MKRGKRTAAALLLCVFAVLLSGCQMHISVGANDTLLGESYPNAEKYQTGACTYPANAIKAVEVYWRSGEVEIIESDNAELCVKESGRALPNDAAMHYLLDDGVLRIRFCASGAKIQVNAADKHVRLEVPKGIALSVHTTSALTKADALNQRDILIAALSGDTELGTVSADTIHLSSSSGSIRVNSISAQSLKCNAASGSVAIKAASVRTLACNTSSGAVTINSLLSEASVLTTSSGSVNLSLTNAPSAEIHTSSGDVSLTLPKNGAEVLHTTSSGKLLTTHAYDQKGDLYVFGESASTITVDTSSGNLRIQ